MGEGLGATRACRRSSNPASGGENLFVESINGSVARRAVDTEEFATLLEADAWGIEYDTYRPQSSLGGLAPAKYAEWWTIKPAETLIAVGLHNGVSSL